MATDELILYLQTPTDPNWKQTCHIQKVIVSSQQYKPLVDEFDNESRVHKQFWYGTEKL